ncbi:MAG: DUF4423 domain-containing protein [Myxococcota bacterium]
MDVEESAKDLIRALRGNRSQTAFSRRLGYRTNVVYTWEAGRRWPSASETLRAAARAGVDLPAAFGRFYRTPPPWLAGEDLVAPAFVARFLRDQQGDTPTSAIAARAGINRFSVARWLAGAAEPRLPDFLRMVEATSLRLLDLLAALADPARLPSVRDAWARREAQRTLAIEAPWAMAVLRLLEVEPARPATVASRLRLDPAEVERCLYALHRAGLVARRRGTWRPVAMEALDTRRSPETARKLKGFWARVGLDRLDAGADGRFAYNLVSVSHDQYRRLQELHDGYFQAVRALVAEDAPPECVALLNLQLVRLDEASPARQLDPALAPRAPTPGFEP